MFKLFWLYVECAVLRFCFILLVGLVFAGGISSGVVFAQANGPTESCNPEIKITMDSRAWMEGAREVEMAQKIIFKADSVLEYSCFNLLSATLATNSPFQGDLIGQAGKVVGEPLRQYIGRNFGHGYLPGSGVAISTDPSVCDVMGQVWQTAKCTDIPYDPDDPNGSDYFVRFDELVGTDFRSAPVACDSASRNTRWANAMARTSMNDASAVNVWNADSNGPYLKAMLGIGGGCADPILTGLYAKARISGLSTAIQDVSNLDAVCPSPGCYYTGGYMSGTTFTGKCLPSP